MCCELGELKEENRKSAKELGEDEGGETTLTFVHVVVLPAPCSPTIMITLDLPF